MPTWVTGILYNNGFTQNPACLQSALFIPDKQAVPRGYPQVPHHRTFRQDILPSGGSCQGSFRSRGQRHPELRPRSHG